MLPVPLAAMDALLPTVSAPPLARLRLPTLVRFPNVSPVRAEPLPVNEFDALLSVSALPYVPAASAVAVMLPVPLAAMDALLPTVSAPPLARLRLPTLVRFPNVSPVRPEPLPVNEIGRAH